MDYFYTDPLAAAWMKFHFDVNFAIRSPRGNTVTYTDLLYCAETTDHRKLYITPDSLHLLEPQVGDLLRGDEHEIPQIRYMDLPDSEQMGAGAALMRRGFKIIQRGGVTFHWPESNAA